MQTQIINALKNENFDSISSEMLTDGRIIAFPTETVYGIGADILNLEAIREIYTLKGRDDCKPLTAHLKDFNSSREVASEIPDEAKIIADHFLPGPLTIILKKKKNINDLVTSGLDTIGIRVPDNIFFQKIAHSFNGNIAATSANFSGKQDSVDAQRVFKYFEGNIPLIIDGGRCNLQTPSSVLDLSRKPYKMLREGYVTKEMIFSECGILISG